MDFRRPRRRIPELELTPLIDVIFQLLIFFLITTTFASSPGLSIQRPQAKFGGALQAQRILIELSKEQKKYAVLQGKTIPLNRLETALRTLFQKTPRAQIAIDADAEVEHQQVVYIMDVAAGVGFRTIGIVTQPASGDVSSKPPSRREKPKKRDAPTKRSSP